MRRLGGDRVDQEFHTALLSRGKDVQEVEDDELEEGEPATTATAASPTAAAASATPVAVDATVGGCVDCWQLNLFKERVGAVVSSCVEDCTFFPV